MSSDDWTTWIWLLHLAATFVMTGVIWTVQLCHYPLFSSVGREGFAAYHARHTTTISFVVMPPMLAEAATCVALLGLGLGSAWFGLSTGLLATVWATTFLVSVPRHQRLERGFDPKAYHGLVRSNWIRTMAWTGRAAIVLALTPRVLAPGATPG